MSVLESQQCVRIRRVNFYRIRLLDQHAICQTPRPKPKYPMPVRAARSPETTLYPPVKAFLEAQGFEVKGEIVGCDIVAVRDDEPPIIVIGELKTNFSLELILQGVDRLSVADQVWLAVPRTRKGRDRDRRARHLCRLMGFGLLAITISTGHVEILAEPTPYKPRPDHKRRRRLLREHAARTGDPAIGGSTRQPVMTAYRQQALTCAAELAGGAKRPRDLKPCAPDAPGILQRNVYGWFERVERGVYQLTTAGETALQRWPASRELHVTPALCPVDPGTV